MTTLAAATASALRTQGPAILDTPKRFVGYVIDFIDPESREARVLYQVIGGSFLSTIASAPVTEKGLVDAAMHAADDLNYDRMVDLAAARSVAFQVAEGVASYHGISLQQQEQPTQTQPAQTAVREASVVLQPAVTSSPASTPPAKSSHYSVAEAMARMGQQASIRQQANVTAQPQTSQRSALASTTSVRAAQPQATVSQAHPAGSSASSSSHYTVAEAMAKMHGGRQNQPTRPSVAQLASPSVAQPASSSVAASSPAASRRGTKPNSSHYTVAEAMARMKSQR